MIPYPQGWCKVSTASGEDGGLGFCCEKCHYQIRHHAPSEVFHCGALEKLDKHWWERLPKVTISPSHAAGFVVLE
jgi:hypothetical protein